MPTVLYHHTGRARRQSISQNGLLVRYDRTGDDNSIKGIYLTDRPSLGHRSDVWEVNVNGLPVERWDNDAQDIDEYGNWFVVYQDIPPDRLKLISNT